MEMNLCREGGDVDESVQLSVSLQTAQRAFQAASKLTHMALSLSLSLSFSLSLSISTYGSAMEYNCVLECHVTVINLISLQNITGIDLITSRFRTCSVLLADLTRRCTVKITTGINKSTHHPDITKNLSQYLLWFSVAELLCVI